MRTRIGAVERQKFIDLILEETYQDSLPYDAHTPYSERKALAQRILRYGATYGRIQETACNSPEYPTVAGLTAEDYNRIDARWNAMLEANERKAERIERKLTELCGKYGIKPVFQGDPRGNTVKLQVPSGKTDDWGREGICVPTS